MTTPDKAAPLTDRLRAGDPLTPARHCYEIADLLAAHERERQQIHDGYERKS